MRDKLAPIFDRIFESGIALYLRVLQKQFQNVISLYCTMRLSHMASSLILERDDTESEQALAE